MEEDTITLVFKITMSNGEIRRHSYSNCPSTKDAFHEWWGKQMKDIFSQTGLRTWVKLKNPTAFYNMACVAVWEFECTGNEEFMALVAEETDFMLQIVGHK